MVNLSHLVFSQEILNRCDGSSLFEGLGQVAFHGREGLRFEAVFTQDGLVAKEGDTLPDDTILGEISESGGVAINSFGQVAFHGQTGGIDAVFRSGSESPSSSAEGGIFSSITW